MTCLEHAIWARCIQEESQRIFSHSASVKSCGRREAAHGFMGNHWGTVGEPLGNQKDSGTESSLTDLWWNDMTWAGRPAGEPDYISERR